MSDKTQGPGWWLASDGKWYPPDQRPGVPSTSADDATEAQVPAPGSSHRRRWVVGALIGLVVVGVVVGVLIAVRGSGGGGPSAVDPGGDVVAVLEFDQRGQSLSARDPQAGTPLWQVEGVPSTGGWAESGRILLLSGRGLEQRDATDGEVVWTSDIGDGVSQVAVVEDSVVAISDETITSLDFDSGEPVWSWVGVDRPVFAFGGGRVVVRDEERRIVALDADSGRELWRSEADVDLGFDVQLRTRSLRIPFNGLPAYVMTDSVMVLYEGSRDDSRDAVALEASSGEEIWRIPGVDHFGVVSVDDMVVLVAREGLLAVDVETGEEQWSWTGSRVPNAGRLGDTIVVTDEGRRVGVDLTSGDVRWDIPFEGGFVVGSAGANLILRSDERTLAVDAASGEVVWEAPATDGTILARDPGRVTGGVMLVVEGPADEPADLRGLGVDVVTGEIRWTQVPEPAPD